MPWKDEHGASQSWSELIFGVQWWRQPTSAGPYEYWYIVTNEGDLPPDIRENPEALEEVRMADGSVGKTAADWDAWAYRATFWTEELYAPDPVDEPAGQEGALSDDDEDDSGDEEEGGDRGAGGDEDLLILDLGRPVVEGPIEARRLADPTVTSARRPQYTKAGAYSWPVTMQVAEPQPVLSWIIQKVVQFDDDEEEATMWEAFPVPADKSEAAAKDIYQDDRKTRSGAIKVAGLMKHFVFTGGSWPPGMVEGGHPHADSRQLSASEQPAFWGDDVGTPHDLAFTWGLFKAFALKTVPDGGDPEEVTSGTIQTG